MGGDEVDKWAMKQREIRFRVWGAWHNNMEPEMAYPNVKGRDYGLTLGGKPIFLDWGGGVSELFGLTLMQFTGLYDKNGKEIYEGDIVKSETNDEDSVTGAVITTIAEVCYGQHPKTHRECDYLASFTLYSTDFYGEHAIFYGRRWTHEVIGNIYENPDLLKSLTKQK